MLLFATSHIVRSCYGCSKVSEHVTVAAGLPNLYRPLKVPVLRQTCLPPIIEYISSLNNCHQTLTVSLVLTQYVLTQSCMLLDLKYISLSRTTTVHPHRSGFSSFSFTNQEKECLLISLVCVDVPRFEVIRLLVSRR